MTTTPVAVIGAMGRMGERVRAALDAHPELALGSAVEGPDHPALGDDVGNGIVVGHEVRAGLEAARVAIVFATPEATVAATRVAAELGVACVIGTTGFSEAQREELDALAGKIPIVRAANFSVSVNVLFHLAREAARLLGDEFDAEIVELHHSAKVDAPSGTALRIGEAVAEGRGQALRDHAVLAREGLTGPRPDEAIGIQTLRGGDNPGEHTLYFVGGGERLELAHRSATRDHFARGAVRAAAWVLGRGPGRYDMEQVLGFAPENERA